ncbi:hypothetical protein B9Q02_09690 [Candidatus Marsarchaeota G1 archaeon BE_D]|uniref:Uncharacterized protein n=1 Tax=Candidatus Marsarchaeota G1 archaeon BE_D TaxID=1978156 RepID=A0A2R6AD00_9ARCH|nr:MAG: hypothetical protein B9Q02_09690 [Candidatus Marsarchaeota G1 archaeon BE_D]
MTVCVSYMSYLLAFIGMALKGSPYLVFSLLFCEWLVTLRILDLVTEGYWKKFFGIWFVLSPVLLIPLSLILVKILIFHEFHVISIFLGTMFSACIVLLLSRYKPIRIVILTALSIFLLLLSIMFDSELLMSSTSLTFIFTGISFVHELIAFKDSKQIT